VSNTLAIAAVTTAIRHVLDEALGGAQPGAVGGSHVTTLRPEQVAALKADTGAPSGLNVYLYEITPNHAWNLTDLPTRRGDGSLTRRPVAAIDLHYLVTAYGDETELAPQRLMARAVLALSVNQVLTRDLVADAVDHYDDDPNMGFLDSADLGEQPELVKLSPQVLTLEELSRLWGILGPHYLLSVAYTATVVVLEAQVSPRTAMPVLQRSLEVAPLDRPQLRSVGPTDPSQRVVEGTTLHLRGSGLHGQVTIVELAGSELVPVGSVTNQDVEVVVGPSVPAGVQAVQVVHRERAGPPGSPPPRTLARSNALPVVVHPRISVVAPPSPNQFAVSVSPPIVSGQRAEMQLTRREPVDDGTNTLTIEVPAPDKGDPPATTVAVSRTGVPTGDWIVRLAVDGAESLPTMTSGRWSGPLLSQP
jgi:hypothetical protein